MPQSDLIIRIGADVKRLSDGLSRGLNDLKRFGFRAESIGRDLTTRLTLPLAAVGTAAVRTFAEFDRLEKGLSAIAGSAAEGGRQFSSLLNLVKDTQTTLDLRTAARASLQLQAVGLSAAESERTIRQLGIAATLSGSSIDDVGGAVRQFGQILARGKVEQEDFNTIVERLPALAGLIRSEFGVSTAEGVRGLGISMEEFISRLTTAAEQSASFQNVQGGLSKSIESFGIELQIVGKELGQTIAEAINLEQVLKDVSSFISNVTQRFKELSPETRKFIVVSAGIAAAAGPVIFSLGAIAKTLPLLTSGFGLLVAPVRGLTGLLGGLGKSISGSIGLFARSGAIQRAVILADALVKPFKLIRVALAAITGPVGLVVGGITLLAASFTRAFNRSETFRKTIQPFIDLFKNIGGAVLNVASSILPDFSSVLSGVGSVVDVVLASVAAFGAGLIKFIQEPIKFIQQQIKAVSQALSGDFSGALATLKSSFSNFGKDTANTFADVFVETLNKELPKKKLVFDPAGLIPQNVGLELPVGIIAPKDLPQPDPVDPPDVSTDRGQLDFLKELDRQLLITANRFELLGSGYDVAATQIELFNNAIDEGLNQGLSPTGPVLTGLVDRLQDLRGALDQTTVSAIQTDLESNLNLGLLNTQTLAAAAGMNALNEKVRELKVNAPQENIFAALQESFIAIEDQAFVFGESFDLIGEKINATKEALALAIEQYGAYSGQVELLQGQLGLLVEQQTALQTALTQIGEASSTAFDRVAQAMNQGATAAQAFGRSVLGAIRDALAAEIKLAVVAAARKALVSVPFPLNIAAASAAGAGASALFTGLVNKIGIPALADGGITTGPTLALIGEAGREAVLPLDKLNQFVNDRGGNANVTGTIRASGQELLVVIENAMRAQKRAF